MADLLTNKKTIQENIRLLFVKMRVAVILLLGIMMIFYFIMMLKHEGEIRKLLTLNEFYRELDELNFFLKQSVIGNESFGEEEKKEAQRTEENIRQNLQTLKNMDGTELLYRNVEDVQGMLETYITRVSELADRADSQKYSLTHDAEQMLRYRDTQQIYDCISREFKPLYSQLMSSVELNEERIREENGGYLLGFIIIIIMLIIYESIEMTGMVNQLTEPILRLADHVKNINIETVQEKIEIEMNTAEMDMLIGSFNMMLQKIREQMHQIQENADIKERLHLQKMENLEISNKLKQSELLTLQMQINPHFLFNTLNMIAQTAYMENADRTIFLLDKTAKLLRYTLDFSGRTVTLERELEMLGNYIYIQEQRFGRKVRFVFSLEEDFHDIKIPSLILQPLVENCIMHGKGTRVETITIHIDTEYDSQNQKGIIRISDNGNGMEKMKLEEVRSGILCEGQTENRVGLRNVYTRLQVFFNGEADMKVYSTPGEGTEIRLILPYKEADEHVQNYNSR